MVWNDELELANHHQPDFGLWDPRFQGFMDHIGKLPVKHGVNSLYFTLALLGATSTNPLGWFPPNIRHSIQKLKKRTPFGRCVPQLPTKMNRIHQLYNIYIVIYFTAALLKSLRRQWRKETISSRLRCPITSTFPPSNFEVSACRRPLLPRARSSSRSSCRGAVAENVAAGMPWKYRFHQDREVKFLEVHRWLISSWLFQQ